MTPDVFTGQRVGRFEVLCKLATGGMSEVLLALQRGLAGFQKLVVIKRILPHLREDPELIQLFLDEARNTAGFSHPNIASVYDLDRDGEDLFVALEFVPGGVLSELADGKPLPLGFAASVVRDAALALHYAHSRSGPNGKPRPVIHRDVAPKNVMVSFDGTTKLLDFGIAKVSGQSARTSVGTVRGSLGYMSPEQMCGEPLDLRTDLFSLGVVLYEALTGRMLFPGGSTEEVIRAVLHQRPLPPSRLCSAVPRALDELTLRAIAPERDDRFQTGAELAQALEVAVGGALWRPEQLGAFVRQQLPEWHARIRHLLEAERSHGDISGTFHRLPAASRPKPPSSPKVGPPQSGPRRPSPSMPLPAFEESDAAPTELAPKEQLDEVRQAIRELEVSAPPRPSGSQPRGERRPSGEHPGQGRPPSGGQARAERPRSGAHARAEPKAEPLEKTVEMRSLEQTVELRSPLKDRRFGSAEPSSPTPIQPDAFKAPPRASPPGPEITAPVLSVDPFSEDADPQAAVTAVRADLKAAMEAARAVSGSPGTGAALPAVRAGAHTIAPTADPAKRHRRWLWLGLTLAVLLGGLGTAYLVGALSLP